MNRLSGIIIVVAMLSYTAKSAEIDASLLPQCLQIADAPNDSNLRSSLEQHESILQLKKNLGDDFHLSFEQIQEQKNRLQHYKKSLPDIEESLPSLIEQATIFIEKSALPDDQKIYFICGAHADGFGFQAEGKTQLFINLTQIQPDFLPSLLRHEIWHAAFRTQHQATTDSSVYHKTALKELAFIMLNEGVGHYYSFQRRVEPAMAYTNWTERTEKIFSLLNEKTMLLAHDITPAQQQEFLFSSHANVPFWKKWGAVPGAIITYRLRKLLGTKTLSKIIAGGPCAFLASYQREAKRRDDWQSLPPLLVSGACQD
ncbi:DUF5700 domain-containing putative Zn-dependent protease [Kordiimonas aquimaris]|uniref:DUF5700 domain-containing putative Zn-dependent protease n=1 Tax=Kordiimonas aquimaris TaxID=707591 RepID=UPI0021CE6907|nr:DUF5700 domain-containing putative Zn-dependent protease [Kordiimonas aquimaris]